MELRSFDLDNEIIEIIDDKNKGGHGGGDKHLVEELKKTIINKKQSSNSMLGAICSAVTSLAIEEARKKEKIVELNSTWKELVNVVIARIRNLGFPSFNFRIKGYLKITYTPLPRFELGSLP